MTTVDEFLAELQAAGLADKTLNKLKAKKLRELEKEVERLRAENAELRKRVAFLGEEPLPLSAHELAELDWFRQRDLYRLDQVKAYYGANIDETDVLQAIDELIEWEKANPKPGAGT